MANVLDYAIIVSEFELQSHYYTHFPGHYQWERYETPYPAPMVYIVPILSYKGCFGIK